VPENHAEQPEDEAHERTTSGAAGECCPNLGLDDLRHVSVIGKIENKPFDA
jgi:hypothetical protein